ncbi:MAG: carboxypeptidase [Rhizobiales bacterium 65-9]|nr:M20 family metallopeptidase [Hyphomicrobiales bacterium]OJY32604.1 MAG: carboxypeptidase [Rhizobiales bacterium 65-9]
MSDAARETRFETTEMLDGIRRWVEIESPTTSPDGVNRMMDAVEKAYDGTGARMERIPGRDGFGDHLIARSPWGQSERGILVLSHLDTVHPIGFINRLPFKVDGDIAYGPGIYDMKGGAYIAFHAFRELTRTGRRAPLPITHLYVSDEEVGSPTSREIIEEEARKAKFVLVTEPAREGGKIVTARKGIARFTMTITGRPAHSGARHEDGRSAVKELARQILTLEGFTDYQRGVTVNVGVVSGGSRANVVPEEAYAEIDMRVPTQAAAEEMVAKVLGLKAHEEGVNVFVTGGLNRPSYEKDERVASLFEHAKALAAQIGFELKDLKTGGGSDGNFTAPIAPTLDGLGVDGKGGHTDYEQLYVSSIAPRSRLLYELFVTLE